MNEKETTKCATCGSSIYVEAKHHIETVKVGWCRKEPQTHYSFGVKCPGCGYEQTHSHIPANECSPEAISFAKKSPHITYEDAVALLVKLGHVVKEDGSIEL